MNCKHCKGLLDPTQKKHFDGSYYCVGNRTHAEPEDSLSIPQPDPVKNDGPAVWDLVIKDMQERDQIGEQRYGIRLQAGNGRDALVDAYQEGLDLVVYLRQALEERHCYHPALLRFTDPPIIILCAHKKGHEGDHSWQALEKFVSIEGKEAKAAAHRVVTIWQAIKDQPLSVLEGYIVQCLQDRDYLEPISMILHCPRCGAQHVDKIEGLDEYYQRVKNTAISPAPERWENPPHKSHLCAKCKCIWRPADISTVGIEAIVSRGEKDTWP